MAVYDTSVILKCLHGDRIACEVIFSDQHCVIPPTTYEEMKFDWNYTGRKAIEEHCRVFTYEDYPFNDLEVRNEVEDFVRLIDVNYLRRTPRGRGAKEVRWFQRFCQGSSNLEHRLNDYRIVKEANILAERGVEGSDVLVSADHSQTSDFCVTVYHKVMESMGEEPLIQTKFYKDVWKEMELEVTPQLPD